MYVGDMYRAHKFNHGHIEEDDDDEGDQQSLNLHGAYGQVMLCCLWISNAHSAQHIWKLR